ncbi:MAG: ATP-binding cassette domain-containing protein [Caldilineaceae bacterium]|nr:ATP-binding cassette domain-containing protein [Caldilineaceae bacterium]
MITLEQVSFSYPDQPIPALQELSLQIDAGEFALLVGASGSGKSTLLRLLNGLAPHFTGGQLRGRLRVHGLDPVQASPQTMSRYVGFVFQDPEAQFVTDRVEDELVFALEQAALPAPAMRLRVEETLDLLDLARLRDRPLATLSGGERQRVAIGAALALRPAILVLDEPTSQLDPQSAEDVLTALVRLNSDLGLTVVLAEHRLERVLPFAERLLYLSPGGRSLLSGDVRTVLRQIDLVPPLVQVGKALGWAPLPLTVKEGLRFSQKAPETLPPAPKNKGPSVRHGAPLLAVQGLTVAYEQQAVLQGVDLNVWPGELVVLMGRNGAGKTTLLRSIVGLVRPQRGQVTLQGRSLVGKAVADICRQVVYLPQDPNSLLFADTVRDEVWITLRNHGLDGAPDAGQRVADLLTTSGLAPLADHYPRDLSVGERQRTALVALLITEPPLIMLDEPTRGLDYAAKERLRYQLQALAQAGSAVIVVTHDVELAATLADRVVLLSQGEVIAAGAPDEVLSTSPFFASQVARLFPGRGWRTAEDVLSRSWPSMTVTNAPSPICR